MTTSLMKIHYQSRLINNSNQTQSPNLTQNLNPNLSSQIHQSRMTIQTKTAPLSLLPNL